MGASMRNRKALGLALAAASCALVPAADDEAKLLPEGPGREITDTTELELIERVGVEVIKVPTP